MAKPKLFISVPMKDRDSADIRYSIKQLHMFAEAIWDKEFEAVTSYYNSEVPPDYVKKESVYHLGNAIKLMSECDYFIGVEYSNKYKGCNIEYIVATDYGLKTEEIPIRFIMRPVEWSRHYSEQRAATYCLKEV